MYHYYVPMNKSAILGLFLVASLIMGTSASMNMFSPATATMSGMTQYDNKNIYQSTYEKDPYANSYGDDKMSNYQQSIYEKDPYANSYSNSYKNDKKQQPSYDKSYDKILTSKIPMGINIATTKIRLKNMSVKKVHLKDSLQVQ